MEPIEKIIQAEIYDELDEISDGNLEEELYEEIDEEIDEKLDEELNENVDKNENLQSSIHKKNEIIKKTIDFVKAEMAGNDSSHDWNHINRVKRLSLFIAKIEGFNSSHQLVVALAAILHDIKDWKYSKGPITAGDVSRIFLSSYLPKIMIEDICFVVDNVGFSHQLDGTTINAPSKLSLQILNIVSDADALDALGAIGIARFLTYGGAKNRILFDPEIKPRENISEPEYKHGKSTTINHFYEKLSKLKDLMKTNTGRLIAQSRHKFMKDFIIQFHNDWESKIDFKINLGQSN